MKEQIENHIRNNYYIKWLATRFLKVACFFDPAFDAHRMYKKHYGRKMDLKNPKNLPEKIVWMELNTDTSMWTYCEDKYLMRKYVEDKGYGEHLPKLYGVWKKAKDIDFASLPNQFVMKVNHGCGDVLVCKDKTKLDERKVRRDFKRLLSLPYGYNNAGWHYTRIKPCVMAEEVLPNDFSSLSTSIVDFKVWCINGKAQSILVVYDRTSGNEIHSVDFYDTDWNRMNQYLNKESTSAVIEEVGKFSNRPSCLTEMLNIAEVLADGFPQVRVDFYVVNNKPIVGEMSFMAGYGSYTEKYYDKLGAMIKI